MTTAIVPGSLAQVARRDNHSLAESFLNVDALILVDVSGSMNANDARDNQSRYEVALQELARLQSEMPGRLGIVAFSTHPVFVPGGAPPLIGAGTNLAAALEFVKVADTGDIRFIVISDGQPDEPTRALSIAGRFLGRIDTVYVGPEGGDGAAFLAQLARAKQGRSVVAHQANELTDATKRLLLTA